MTTASPRAFTLIELLVVIAIIGILSSVVLASLGSARTKGTDAAIKSDLNTIRSQAALAYDTLGNTYYQSGSSTLCLGTGCLSTNTAGTLFADTTIMRAMAHIADLNKAGASTNLYMYVGPSSYVVAATLGTSGTYWCIDSNGASRGKTVGGTAYTALYGNSSTTATVDWSSSCN